MKCPICGNENRDEFISYPLTQKINRVRCKFCLLYFITPKPQQLPKYDLPYNLYFFRPCDIAKAGIMAGELAQLLMDNFKKPNVLEIGCGNGLTSLLLQKMGFKLTAHEYTEQWAMYIKHQIGVPCAWGKFEETIFLKSYDLIYAGHVIEHSWEPLDFLRQCNLLLSDNGILYLDSPDGWYATKKGKNWHHFKTRNQYEHCSIFTHKTLKIAAQNTGFTLERFEQKNKWETFHAILRKQKNGFDFSR